MLEKYLAESDIVGATAIESLDGGLMVSYGTDKGKHFLKSYDKFRTIAESWIVPVGGSTASANLLRLRDGRLMMIVREVSANEKIAKIGGADFYAVYSDDDGKTFGEFQKINKEENCYYIMNNRVIRTHTGRVLIPVCYVPTKFTAKKFQEKAGYAGCFYSDDDCKTWNLGEWLENTDVDQLAEPMIAQGKDDVLHMYARTGYGYLYRSRSFDDGITWETAQPSMLRSPCAPFCINYDKYSDKYFAIWDNSFPAEAHGGPRTPICLAVSDDCINWKICFELGNNPFYQYGYPMIYFDEKEILITYYENPSRRYNVENHKLKMKLFSRDEIFL